MYFGYQMAGMDPMGRSMRPRRLKAVCERVGCIFPYFRAKRKNTRALLSQSLQDPQKSIPQTAERTVRGARARLWGPTFLQGGSLA